MTERIFKVEADSEGAFFFVLTEMKSLQAEAKCEIRISTGPNHSWGFHFMIYFKVQCKLLQSVEDIGQPLSSV